MRRKLLNSVFLFLLTVLFLSSGSSWAVIYISNITDLQKIGNDPGYPLNGEYELTQDIDASDTVNWNSGAGFAPIGTQSNPFAGKFDGKGYKITGLYINRPWTDYIGLFGCTGSGSEVKNLGLENCQTVGYRFVGGLVSYTYEGTVRGSYSTGVVWGYEYVGGFVGRNVGTVRGCYSTGSVSGDEHVGGLVGWNSGIVSGCYSTGVVRGYEYVGGLLGRNENMVSNSYSTGSARGNDNIGGLVGENYYGNVSSCYSTGSARGDKCVGGFMGSNYRGTVNNSYAMGSVTGSVQYIGGLIGYLYGNIYRCYSTGLVDGSGSDKGGLIGYKEASVTITSSYWDTQTSGMSTSAGGTGKTTVQMKQQATFSGWDFVDVWGIIENTTYPYLRWQYAVPDVIGMTQSNAESEITGAGLTVGTASEQCSDTVPAGRVISQDPIGGQQVPPGTAVNLVVSTGPCPVSVPNVVGMTQSEAESAITGAGLTVGMVSEQCSDTVPAGRVISQEPTGGQQVPPGTAVNLVVSTGPCPVSVPNVVGMTQLEAESAITGAGLSVGTVSEQCSDTVPAGRVISQEPTGGQQVPPGTAVDIVVSTGPCPVTVPDVVGMTQVDAESTITGAGLTVGTVSEQYSDTVPAGRVISQEPTGGQQVPPGTAVDIVVSTGPCPVTVPDVVGMTQVDAESTITGAGLTVGTVYEQCSDTVPAGRVISQEPTGGQQVPPGTAVNIVVSTGPCPVSVPDVVGMTQAEAESAITGAGLTVGTVSEQYSDTVPAGNVISQDPSGGEQVLPGTSIDLVISKGPCLSPDVIGTTLVTAINTIVSANLNVGTVTEECNNTYPAGIVFWQNPGGGEVVTQGTSVNLKVSSGPCPEGEGEGVVEGEGIIEGEGTPEGTPEGEGVIEGEGTPEGEGIVEGTPEGTTEGEGVVEGIPEGEGTVEGTPEGEGVVEGEGTAEGTPEGTVEGVTEGTVEGEGIPEGIPEGSMEGEGTPEGTPEGEGVVEGEGTPEGEGIVEGTPEGEGIIEGAPEGIPEGTVEGTPDGEGTPEGEGVVEGEGLLEGEGSSEGERPPHSADPNGDGVISLSELLRVIQFFNTGGYHCEAGSEDGYAPGSEGDQTCTPHASDYNPQDWIISLSELLRLIQFFNYGGYHPCPDGEDGYCPGL